MYTTLSGKTVTFSSSIAKGGEGEVFGISGNSIDCVKIYHEHIRNKEKEAKLKHMCQNQPIPLESENYRICWPKDLIYENGNFIGYVMPKAFDSSILPYHLCQLEIPKKLGAVWNNTFDRNSTTGAIARLKLCTNMVAVIARVLSTGTYVLVDLKPQNILVTNSGKVSLIDLDSVQISKDNKIIFKAPVSTPEYTPPEAKKLLKLNVPISQDWDVFSVGVLVYEIMCGIHPYAGTLKPPLDNVSTINEKIEKNLTYIIKGELIYSKLPPPHQTFNNFSSNFKNVFKKIFAEYTIGTSSRPNLEKFGVILFEEVTNYKDNILKIQQNKALQDNLILKGKILTLTNNYTLLKTKYENLEDSETALKAENKKLEEQVSNSHSSSWSWFFFIVCVIGGLLFFAYYTETEKKMSSLKSDNYEVSQKNLGSEYELQEKINKINELNSLIETQKEDISSLQNTITDNIGPFVVQDVEFRSSRGNGEYNAIDYGETLYTGTCYYLYPRIKYVGIKEGVYDIYVKFINPDGTLKLSTSGPLYYTMKYENEHIYAGENTMFLRGYGNSSGGSYNTGNNVYEIWVDDNMIYRKNFYIY